jgi:hypothetical protein
MDLSFALQSFATWLSERSARMEACQQTPYEIHRSIPPIVPVDHQQHTDALLSPTRRDVDYFDHPSSSDAASVTHTTTSGSMSSTTGASRSAVSPASEDLPPLTALSIGTTSYSQPADHTSTLGSQKDTWTTRGMTLRRAFKTSKEKLLKGAELSRPTSFCFSANGKSLALWGGNFRGFARFGLSGQKDSAIDGSVKWELAAVKQVAIGSERCIVLASHQEVGFAPA